LYQIAYLNWFYHMC
jgi:hypothetical protein